MSRVSLTKALSQHLITIVHPTAHSSPMLLSPLPPGRPQSSALGLDLALEVVAGVKVPPGRDRQWVMDRFLEVNQVGGWLAGWCRLVTGWVAGDLRVIVGLRRVRAGGGQWWEGRGL